MKVYVAAPWAHKAEARTAAAQIAAAGHTLVSRWLREHEDTTDPHELTREALADEADVHECEAMVLLALCKSDGKATELGMARTLNRLIIIVYPGLAQGNTPTGNVFYHLPNLIWVATVEGAIQVLSDL